MSKRSTEFLAAIRCAAIVDREDGEALLKQDLMEPFRGSPRIAADQLGGRATVDIDNQWNFPRCIRRKPKLAVQRCAIFRPELQKLGSDHAILSHGAPLPHFAAWAASSTEGPSRRRQNRGEQVHPVLAVVGEIGEVYTLVRCQTAKIRAIEFHCEHMLLVKISLIRGEVNRVIVHSLHAEHFVISLFKLPLQFCFSGKRILLVEAVQVKMSITIAPA